MLILLSILIYFALLFVISRVTSGKGDNGTFYRARRQAPWYMVAFGMVGASISGVTFVSVPGMVEQSDMTYLQTCMGFVVGYFLVAYLLLPIFYRLNLTTIYTFLLQRLGKYSYKTGASFFLLSKMAGASVRFYLACVILHQFAVVPLLSTFDLRPSTFDPQLSFLLTVVVMVLLIWLYTRRGGIGTLVWTDTFQTICMFTALLLIIYMAISQMGMNIGEAVQAIAADSHSRIFVFDDWMSKQNFWKQFLSGIFIVVVMTGLDQDMMQKNLTCKTLRDAQKDMCTYGFAFLPANLLFLSLGVLLIMLFQQQGVTLPESSDQLLPTFIGDNSISLPKGGPGWVSLIFVLGIVAASFSSADSALTAMTTSFCVDICGRPDDERLRKRMHFVMAIVFMVFILLFELLNSTSIIDAIYVMCSYTYGPLLGLFAYALWMQKKNPMHRMGERSDRLVPYIAVASPLLCFALELATRYLFHYQFGYELLMVNGLITFLGLKVLSKH